MTMLCRMTTSKAVVNLFHTGFKLSVRFVLLVPHEATFRALAGDSNLCRHSVSIEGYSTRVSILTEISSSSWPTRVGRNRV